MGNVKLSVGFRRGTYRLVGGNGVLQYLELESDICHILQEAVTDFRKCRFSGVGYRWVFNKIRQCSVVRMKRLVKYGQSLTSVRG